VLTIRQGPTPALRPPHPSPLPLWLALLLHRQNRATVLPPPWLSVSGLEEILANEIASPDTFTHGLHEYPAGAAVAALPYHYLTLSHLLLTHCQSSFSPGALGTLSTLLRSIREVRQAKMRKSMGDLEGGGVVSLRGVGALEVAEERGFVTGVIGGLRKLGESRESARREREGEDGGGGGGGLGGVDDEDEDEEMEQSMEY